jgi:PST family polysaccharide transporter
LAANLTRNISYLSLSQLANYVFPLIVIPYVTRTLGPESYALTEFAGVIMVYFVSVVEFGFFTTATRRVAQLKEGTVQMAQIFSAVLQAKMLLMVLSLIILAGLILLVPKFNDNALLLSLSVPLIMGAALSPDFLFLGTQRASTIAFTNMMVKAAATASIFLFISEPEDYLWLNFINGLATVGLAILLLYIGLKRIKGLRLLMPKKETVKALLWESRFIFISNFSTRLYGFISIPMGAFLMSPQQLGLFAAASKLINVGQNVLFQPLHGALFPHLAALIKEDEKAYRVKHRQFLTLLALAVALLVLLLILIAPWVVPLVFGSDYQEAIPYLQWMTPIWFLGVFAHLYLQQGLLILKKDKPYMWIVLTTGLISIVLNYWLISGWQAQGAVGARLITEAILAILAALTFYKIRQR